ncbi:hypothetical protein [Candidatus Phaeomarinobacter ectocarpi]|uniref:hypothetical protein n=1 Tax=Candidatus Phaeomarinibacter ectocarpi TaxID=1458461 RepID=UPI000698048A|nr:hypothetical protein [Candidatus Phaeomarinobacter ectocarpi]
MAVAALVAFIVGLASLQESLATTYSVEFQHRHDVSDMVAVIKVTSSTKRKTDWDTCGFQYEATVIEHIRPLQGQPAPTQITFGRHASLRVGEQYLLFLKHWNEPDTWLRDFYAQPEHSRITIPGKADGLELAECGGLIPGLQFDHIALGHRVDQEFLFSHPAAFYKIPKGIKVRQVGSNVVAIHAGALLHYLRSLGTPSKGDSNLSSTDTLQP